MDSANNIGASAPDSSSWNDWPAQSKPKPGGKSSRTMRSISFIASPELLPGPGPPLMLTAGKPLKRACDGGATVQVDCSSDDNGTMPSLAISPAKENRLVSAVVPAGR